MTWYVTVGETEPRAAEGLQDIESAVLAYMDGEAPSGAPWVDVTDEFTDS